MSDDASNKSAQGPATGPTGQAPAYKLGDVANGHMLTVAGWLPLRRLVDGWPGPYCPGDMLNGHVFTGSTWVPVGEFGAPQAGVATSGSGVPGPVRRRGTRWLWALGVAMLVGLWVAMLVGPAVLGTISGKADDKPSSVTTAPTPTPPDGTKTQLASAAPDPEARYAERMRKNGWAKWPDGLWGKVEVGDRTTFSVSWNFHVVSPTGCPDGIYIEANVVDSSKRVVGFTNDLLPSLAPKQEAVLELTASADASDGTLFLSPTQVTCN